jgi:hypothetical protein
MPIADRAFVASACADVFASLVLAPNATARRLAVLLGRLLT